MRKGGKTRKVGKTTKGGGTTIYQPSSQDMSYYLSLLSTENRGVKITNGATKSIIELSQMLLERFCSAISILVNTTDIKQLTGKHIIIVIKIMFDASMSKTIQNDCKTVDLKRRDEFGHRDAIQGEINTRWQNEILSRLSKSFGNEIDILVPVYICIAIQSYVLDFLEICLLSVTEFEKNYQILNLKDKNTIGARIVSLVKTRIDFSTPLNNVGIKQNGGAMQKICAEASILNPTSNRCVSKKGALGKSILAKQSMRERDGDVIENTLKNKSPEKSKPKAATKATTKDGREQDAYKERYITEMSRRAGISSEAFATATKLSTDTISIGASALTTVRSITYQTLEYIVTGVAKIQESTLEIKPMSVADVKLFLRLSNLKYNHLMMVGGSKNSPVKKNKKNKKDKDKEDKEKEDKEKDKKELESVDFIIPKLSFRSFIDAEVQYSKFTQINDDCRDYIQAITEAHLIDIIGKAKTVATHAARTSVNSDDLLLVQHLSGFIYTQSRTSSYE